MCVSPSRSPNTLVQTPFFSLSSYRHRKNTLSLWQKAGKWNWAAVDLREKTKANNDNGERTFHYYIWIIICTVYCVSHAYTKHKHERKKKGDATNQIFDYCHNYVRRHVFFCLLLSFIYHLIRSLEPREPLKWKKKMSENQNLYSNIRSFPVYDWLDFWFFWWSNW